MRGIVWYEERVGDAHNMLKTLQDNYARMGYNITRKKFTFFEAENGDRWDIRRAESSRGYRANVSYIDKNIPQEVIERIIMPQTSAHPWFAVNYF